MNKRRLSYGLLVTFAAAAFVAGCGDSTPEATTPPQPTVAATAEPAPTATAAEVTPPPAPKPEPPPPPKPAKDKFAGKFVQDFSGEVADAAEADAVKKAGKKDKDNKKHDAAIAKAKDAVAANTLETALDGFTWSVKGKAAHTVKFEIVGGDEKTVLVKLVKDGKKDLKPPVEVTISVSDDSISFKDPFAKKKDAAMTLVFKRQ